MKNLIIMLLFGSIVLTSKAQEKIYQINEISILNYGDGRLLFRLQNDAKTPLQGKHRIIDGYYSEYILAEFKDGMYNGKYEKIRNNNLQESAIYKEGRLHGERLKYHLDGKTVCSKATFIDGKIDGISTTYTQDSKIESEKSFKMGIDDGIDKIYDENGNTTSDKYYKDGKAEGKWVEHISSNIGNFTRTSSYKNGKYDGNFSEIWANDNPRKKGCYKDGKMDGVWIIYHDNDGIPEKSTTYKDGKKNGEEKRYFINGKIESSIDFLDNERNGISKKYYLEGNLESEYTYKNGNREGTYKRFYNNGKLKEEGRFEKDIEVFRKEYFNNGKLKSVSERKGLYLEVLEQYDDNDIK